MKNWRQTGGERREGTKGREKGSTQEQIGQERQQGELGGGTAQLDHREREAPWWGRSSPIAGGAACAYSTTEHLGHRTGRQACLSAAQGQQGPPRSVTLALSSPGSQLFMNTEVFVESMTSARLKGTSGPV